MTSNSCSVGRHEPALATQHTGNKSVMIAEAIVIELHICPIGDHVEGMLPRERRWCKITMIKVIPLSIHFGRDIIQNHYYHPRRHYNLPHHHHIIIIATTIIILVTKQFEIKKITSRSKTDLQF